MAASKQCYSEKKDFKEDLSDTWIGPTYSTQSKKGSPDEQIKHLKLMFESVEDMLRSPDYDEDLKDEMSKACPNYMAVFSTSKRDLLRNDCGIVLTGETSAGKTTLINQLVGKKLFVTGNLAATGRITRIRNSEKLEIKCYSRDDILKKEDAIQDFKQLKVFLKSLTDIEKIPKDLQDVYYVDVYLPVPILKGNVIIVDTPGICGNERLDKILLDFLPHAVSFVFVVNARNAGGIHEDRLSKILKTIVDNREKMPCFDPGEIMILTNQWDIIDNEDPSSDEDDDGKSEKINEHSKTWKRIQEKFENGWGLFDEENMFRVSLKQVEKRETNFFTNEYKRFESVLMATINKNKNKRVEYYYRYLKDFIRNAERGTLIRLNLLTKSKEEQQRIINQNNARIHDLQRQCKQKSQELEQYKTKMIKTLAKKLHEYLNSSKGREEILNPPGKKRISEVSILFISEEVPFRLQSGIRSWCKGPEVKSIIEDADDKIRVFANDIELKLHEIEVDMRGGTDTYADSTYIPGGATIVLGLLLLPVTLVLVIVVGILAIPTVLLVSLFTGSENRLNMANSIYDQLVQKIPMPLLRGGFEQSFGIEYSKAIVRVFDESLPNVTESLLIMNEKLLHTQNDIKQKEKSFKRLEKKIQQIQIATNNFERDY